VALPAPVLAIGAGKATANGAVSIVVATERGLARVDGTKVTPIARAPKQVLRLVDDRWAILGSGAHDLRAGKTIALPAVPSATVAIDDQLVAAAAIGGKLELWTIARGKLDREPIGVTPAGTPVGIAVDRRGRAVVALADGRLLVKDRATWTSVAVQVDLPAARPGSPPAVAR
jgi:hypothetical protein